MEALNKLEEQGLKKLILDFTGTQAVIWTKRSALRYEFLKDMLLIVFTEGQREKITILSQSN